MTLRAYIWIPALLLLSCQVVFDYEKLQAGEATTPDSGSPGSAGADGGDTADPCPNLEAPNVQGTILVKLPRDDGKSCFFMDKHEVTRAQYLQFANSGTIQPQGAECEWNTMYTDPACEDASTRITKEDNQPMVCVDQCDAQKYCESVGKTLCHGDKIHASEEDQDDWYAACSNYGETSYPYGNVASDMHACNLQARNTTWDIDTATLCKNDAGVVDLLGNVSEWVGGPEACSSAGGAGDDCLVRGGSFILQQATCETLYTPKRNKTEDSLGFRCCAYPGE